MRIVVQQLSKHFNQIFTMRSMIFQVSLYANHASIRWASFRSGCIGKKERKDKHQILTLNVLGSRWWYSKSLKPKRLVYWTAYNLFCWFLTFVCKHQIFIPNTVLLWASTWISVSLNSILSWMITMISIRRRIPAFVCHYYHKRNKKCWTRPKLRCLSWLLSCILETDCCRAWE